MLRVFINALRSDGGAVAPTLALSLTALIAAGGIAFDYARLASMDTELQNAADQAALAAATQLDGEAGARARAISAARQLISNSTLFANDGGGTNILVPTVIFYENYDPVTGVKGPLASDDSTANFVLVTVQGRTANYALTPIVAALRSDPIDASAFATLDSAWCNLPPFLMCTPSANFNAADHIGHGMRLVIGSTTAPGNFGFMQTGFGEGAENLAKAIGWNGSAGGCVASRGVVTEPGNKQSVRAALNTRFDLSMSGQTCPAGGTCSPSTNVRKDLVHGNSCGFGGQQGWREPDVPYRAPNQTPLSAANPMIPASGTTPARVYPDTMGHPRDLCHAVSEAGACADPIVGDGLWDRDAYFFINYGWSNAQWKAATSLSDNPNDPNYATRYKVYRWEAANPLPASAPGRGIGVNQTVQVSQGGGGGTVPRYGVSWTGTNPASSRTCRAPGIPPTSLDDDRRVMSVAIVDCAGLSGRDTVRAVDWVDVFLVEPTIRRDKGGTEAPRTDDGDVYVEIVGTRPLPGIGQSAGNIIRRDVPRLIE